MNRPASISTRTQSSLAELDHLMSYAERLQDTIQADHRARRWKRFFAYFAVGLAAGTLAITVAAGLIFSQMLTSPVIWSLGSVAIGLLLAAVFTITIELPDELAVEKRILGETIEMISSLIRHLEDEASPIERKLMSLRLRRLRLSWE